MYLNGTPPPRRQQPEWDWPFVFGCSVLVLTWLVFVGLVIAFVVSKL